MFDFLRNMGKSKAEKRQEAISAYLDNELSAVEKRRFEKQMAADAGLRHDVEQQRFIKLNVSRLPSLKAPRRFTLDPQRYGRPVAQGYFKLYPAMRVATVLAGIFFVLAIGIEFLNFSSRSGVFGQSDQVSQLSEAEPAAEMMLEAESAMTEGEGPPKSQELPEPSIEIVEEVLETELAAEEAAAMEAPAEEAIQAAEPQMMEETEGAAGEIESPLPVTGEPAAESEVSEEVIVEEVVVESLLTSPEPGKDGAGTAQFEEIEPEATPIFPTGGGGERPQETPQVPASDAAAMRATVTVTETPTGQPGQTPSPTQPTVQEVARAEEIGPAEDSDLANAAAIEETGIAEDSDEVGAAEAEMVIVPTRQLPPGSREPAPEIPVLRLLIAALGIAVILFFVVTLLIRRQTKY